MQLSLRALENLESKYQATKKQVARIREEAAESVMTVVRSAEIQSTAFAMGVVNGRWGRPELLGVPVDLLMGLTGHTLGFVIGEEAGPHLHNLADGALASYVTTLGVGIGQKMLQESQASAQQLAAP